MIDQAEQNRRDAQYREYLKNKNAERNAAGLIGRKSILMETAFSPAI
jgi:hypothetical protein